MPKFARQPKDRRQSASGGFLYRLAIAFPTWAGALVALYSIFVFGSGLLRAGKLR